MQSRANLQLELKYLNAQYQDDMPDNILIKKIALQKAIWGVEDKSDDTENAIAEDTSNIISSVREEIGTADINTKTSTTQVSSSNPSIASSSNINGGFDLPGIGGLGALGAIGAGLSAFGSSAAGLGGLGALAGLGGLEFGDEDISSEAVPFIGTSNGTDIATAGIGALGFASTLFNTNKKTKSRGIKISLVKDLVDTFAPIKLTIEEEEVDDENIYDSINNIDATI